MREKMGMYEFMILGEVVRCPGTDVRTIMRTLDIGDRGTRENLRKLTNEGLVRQEKRGRKLYFPTDHGRSAWTREMLTVEIERKLHNGGVTVPQLQIVNAVLTQERPNKKTLGVVRRFVRMWIEPVDVNISVEDFVRKFK